MPHIIVEYSSGLKDLIDTPSMLKDLHNAIDGFHNVGKARIKTRAHCLDHYVVGESEQDEMVHVELKLMPGRTDEMKTELLGLLKKNVQKHIANARQNVALTLEVSELHGPTYSQ